MPKAKSATIEAAEVLELDGSAVRLTRNTPSEYHFDLAARLRREDRELKRMQWVPVTRRLPKCDKRSNSFGVPVLVWPPQDFGVAYYGRRITREPSFYLHDAIIDGVTHWMPLPKSPSTARRRNHEKA